MFVPGRFLVLALIVAILARIHGIIKVLPYGLLEGLSLGKIVFLIARMAGDAMDIFCFMDIRVRTPLAASLLSIGDGMTGPAVLVRRCPDDLLVETFEVGSLLQGIVDRDLVCLRVFNVPLRKVQFCPARAGRGPFSKESSTDCSPPFLPLIPLQVADEAIRLA
jgi:hypothetical protein